MKKSKKKVARKQPRHHLFLFFAVFGVFVVSAFALGFTLPQASLAAENVEGIRLPPALSAQYRELSKQLRVFEDKQTQSGFTQVPQADIATAISQIQLQAASGSYANAEKAMKKLKANIALWNNELTIANGTVGGEKIPNSTPGALAAGSRFIPIVLYHYTPVNFDQQLTYLETHGYTVIDLDQVARAVDNNGLLPAKPVVITFDDGFANQMQAFAILKAHNMKATFYIINGGPASRWCIGAGRRYRDPLQPPQGCGDTYLTWDQVRMLDTSGLITIGGHTIDHSNLPSLTPELQRYEIIQGKKDLEQQLGHPIYHFAYPYGSYNATSIEIVREAGYTTATTVLPGTYQAPNQPYSLHRVRDTISLP